ncbi:hypothetical protein OC842_002005 [Tilletia horrida]|uniref:Anaphase-promoting complex subunit 4 WD40 domain-containing protein n=1 Tax=Tilletia horrida TaxID=155126 RepID=A0AAN6GE13_9BASI|nr:hypothetical protein OC842_002005 [Tilletia horrida]
MNTAPSSTPGAYGANPSASPAVPGSSAGAGPSSGSTTTAAAVAGFSGTNNGTADGEGNSSSGSGSAAAPAPPQGSLSANGSSAAGPTTILSTSIELNARRLNGFKPAKVFADAVTKGQEITSLSFDAKGEWMVSAAEDDFFRLYKCRSGKLEKEFASHKYGVDLARFTHKPDTIIYASTREDNAIRYHSMTDNKYLAYFRGHESRVTSLQMSPVDDTFMSAAANESVRLWDIKSPKAFGKLRIQGHAIVAYDSSGQVIAIALNERAAVVLYDIKNFEKAPFLTIHIDDSAALSQISYPPRYPTITYLEFAPGAGSTLLVGTASGVHYLIDAFEGTLRRRLVGGRIGLEPEGLAAVDAHAVLEKEAADQEEKEKEGSASTSAVGGSAAKGEEANGVEGGKERLEGEAGGKGGPTPRSMFVPSAGISGSECCFTPDGAFILSGSATGQVFVWQVPKEFREVDNGRNLEPVAVLNGHQGPSRCVAFNPRSAMLSTAGRKLAFWLPDLDED